MSKLLMESLKMDLPALADLIRSKGRKGDSVLAHISPKEAALLKRRGGSGEINPETGLPQFENEFDASTFDIGFGPGQYSAPATPAETQGTTFTPQEASMYGYSDSPNVYTGKNIVLPGEGGDIPAFQPNTPGSQPLLQTSAQAPTVGFPQNQFLPPTYQETPTPPELKDLQKGGPQEAQTTQSVYDRLSKALGSDKALEAISRLGLTGALGVYGAGVARKGAGQIQAATQEQKAIAQPYQQQGQQLVGQAQRGELTPQSQQALDAAKAQLAQSTATRGGVGAQQAANQIANLYQNLLGNQYTYGLSIMQIGDNYATGAIKSGLQLDQQLQQSTNNFYSQLASIAAGGTGNIPFAPGVQTQRT